MDISPTGQLSRIARQLGTVVDTSVTEDAGDVLARAFHVERPGAPDVAVAGSSVSTGVVALLMPGDNAAVAMAAARVLAYERGDQLRPGRVVTLPAGGQGARSVRGSTGAFALVPASAAGLPKSIDVVAVHAQPPLSEWDKATLDEVTSAVPDLVSRFRPPKSRTAQPARRPGASAKRTVVRRRTRD